jgi:hypothetical protein
MSTSTDLKRELVDPLIPRSIEVLKAGQAPSGAFIATPGCATVRSARTRSTSSASRTPQRHGIAGLYAASRRIVR